MKEQKWIIAIVVGIMAMAGIFFSLSVGNKPSDLAKEAPLTPFGQYLKDNNVKFYGAEWCPHCQNMKKNLGEGTWKPVYIECAEGANKIAKVCEDAKIDGFPTFELKNGERHVGEMSVSEFEEFVGYKPAEASSTPVDVK